MKPKRTANISFPHPIGTQVIVTFDNGHEQLTRTRSEPDIVGGQQVIWLEGISGCYLLSRVRVARKVGCPFCGRHSVRCGGCGCCLQEHCRCVECSICRGHHPNDDRHPCE